jgi:hypothetical protein
LGATNIPNNVPQYKIWIRTFLLGEKAVHHFGFSAICWAIWKARNKAIFDRKLIRHPAEIIMHACSFMSYWAGLYHEGDSQEIVEGVGIMLVLAQKLVANQRASVGVGMLPAPKDQAEDGDED